MNGVLCELCTFVLSNGISKVEANIPLVGYIYNACTSVIVQIKA